MLHSLLAPFSISRAYGCISVRACTHSDTVCAVQLFSAAHDAKSIELLVPLKLAPPPISPAVAAVAFRFDALQPLAVESLALSTVPFGRCWTIAKLLSHTPVRFCWLAAEELP